MLVQATDIIEPCILTVAHRGGNLACGALEDAKTGLWIRPKSRTRLIRCAFLDGCERFLHCPLFSHPKLVGYTGKQMSNNDLIPIL